MNLSSKVSGVIEGFMYMTTVTMLDALITTVSSSLKTQVALSSLAL